MSKPADTHWGMRSDKDYGGNARRNHPLILTQRQALSQTDEPTATSLQGQGAMKRDHPAQCISALGTGI